MDTEGVEITPESEIPNTVNEVGQGVAKRDRLERRREGLDRIESVAREEDGQREKSDHCLEALRRLHGDCNCRGEKDESE